MVGNAHFRKLYTFVAILLLPGMNFQSMKPYIMIIGQSVSKFFHICRLNVVFESAKDVIDITVCCWPDDVCSSTLFHFMYILVLSTLASSN